MLIIEPLNLTVESLNLAIAPLMLIIEPLNLTVESLDLVGKFLNLAIAPLMLIIESLNLTVESLNLTVESLDLVGKFLNLTVESLNLVGEFLSLAIESLRLVSESLILIVESLKPGLRSLLQFVEMVGLISLERAIAAWHRKRLDATVPLRFLAHRSDLRRPLRFSKPPRSEQAQLHVVVESLILIVESLNLAPVVCLKCCVHNS
jgi:hypothetical protein